MTDTKSTNARTMIAQIIERIATPNGFAKLSPVQRKFLLAAILSSIVPADGKVREIEIDHLRQHLQHKYQLNAEQLREALAFAGHGLPGNQMQQAAKHLPDLLSIDDRASLIGMMWDIALSDKELHTSEEAMIYKFADDAGVARKKVVEQQARIAANRGG
jgi:uncharacterized tellurite resistance protein B-like protein